MRGQDYTVYVCIEEGWIHCACIPGTRGEKYGFCISEHRRVGIPTVASHLSGLGIWSWNVHL